MSVMLTLKPLSVFDGQAEWEMLQTLPAEHGFDSGGYDVTLDDFPDWLLSKVKEANSIELADGRVPQHFYWLMLSEEGQVAKPIGLGKLRPLLTPWLLDNGGNIAYGISPDFRGKGYASQLLILLLERARSKGLDMAMLTVSTKNPASYKTIEKQSGILEKDDGDWRWYWIYL